MENISWDAIPIILLVIVIGIGIFIGSLIQKNKDKK